MSDNVAVNQSTQTFEVLDDKLRIDLLTLANMFLHGSYWFVTLSSLATRLRLQGFAWALKEKELKCKENALTILNWIGERAGPLEFADIAKPRYRESEVSQEFIVKRWNDIEDWIENKINGLKGSYEDNTVLEDLLDEMFKTLKSVAPSSP